MFLNADIKLYNMEGMLIKQVHVEDGTTYHINAVVARLPMGFYTLHLEKVYGDFGRDTLVVQLIDGKTFLTDLDLNIDLC
ncbi:MAG: hypothetical protein GY751_05850 [Bacteroidetes bacterium]|nr:hypothetical protein [Bacteroidota bacterium]